MLLLLLGASELMGSFWKPFLSYSFLCGFSQPTPVHHHYQDHQDHQDTCLCFSSGLFQRSPKNYIQHSHTKQK
jgi:hypothetical protein